MDASTRAAAQIHDRLRALLIQHFDRTPAPALGTALAYELASLIAAAAPTEADAIELVTSFADVQVRQIRRFGVGHPHP